jgi:hypothetical protein
MPNSAINLLQHQIGESHHDIESNEIYINKQDDSLNECELITGFYFGD